MRLAWGMVVVFCLGFPAWGAICPQQEGASSVNATGQAVESVPKKEPPAEQKKETQVAPQTEIKAEPKTESQQSQNQTVPKVESEETGPEIQPTIQPTIEPQSAEAKSAATKKADGASTGAAVKRHSAAKHAAAIVTDSGPRKVVVREGGADEPTAQIVTGMAPEEASRQREDAEKLLTTTVATLERIDPDALDRQQQEAVSQIHNYMAGARAALKEGDISRGHTLAVKAGLLAEDLAEHQ
ncbi:MAG: hypothetical protein WA172_03905 [Terriglobales bacterium]